MKQRLFVALLCGLMALTCGAAFASAPVTGNADIVFILDTTGSMSPYITSVDAELNGFLEELKKYNLTTRFAVLEYKDVTYSSEKESVFAYEFDDGSHWSKANDAAACKDKLQLALKNVRGGGDWAETPLPALGLVNDWTDWNTQNGLVVFILTDADAKDRSGNDGIEILNDSIISSLKQKGIIVSLISRVIYKEHYSKLFKDTDGVFIDIDAPDWKKSMLDIASYISDLVGTDSADRLPHTTVENAADDTAKGDTLAKEVAEKTDGVDADDITVINGDNAPYFDQSTPQEITTDDREKLETAGIEVITKIDTVTLYGGKDVAKGTPGYFLLKFDIPSDVVTKNTEALGEWDPLNQIYSNDGFVSSVMLNSSAEKQGKLIAQPLVLLYGKADDTLVLYLVKAAKNKAVAASEEETDTAKKIWLWASNKYTEGTYTAKTDVEKYIDTNREKNKGILDMTIGEALEKGASYLQSLYNKAKEDGTLQEIIDKVKEWISDSGGCDAGFGLVGVVALAGLAFRKRSR